MEYALNCHWSLKAEYNHLFFKADDVTGIETEGARRDTRIFHSDPNLDLVQFGLNYRF